MTLDELKGLSPTDAIAKVAEFAGVSPSTIDGQWRVESNRGTHPTMTNSKSSAKGHFQFIDKTHDTWQKRLGQKLDRFDFSDALFEYGHQMKENMTATKGNEADAVRMFYRGPDRSMWGDADVADYTRKVYGKNTPSPARSSTPSNFVDNVPAGVTQKQVGKRVVETPARPASELFDLRGIDVNRAYADAAQERPPLVFGSAAPAIKPGDAGDNAVITAGVAASTLELNKRQAAKDNQGFFGLYDRDTTLGASYSRTLAPLFDVFMDKGSNVPDPAFVKDFHANWKDRLAGFTETEQDRLTDSMNKDEYQHNLFRIQERRQDDLTSSRAGTLSVLGADLMAGVLDPTTWATGIAAGKAFAMAGYGSSALAAAGRPTAAALSAAGENVVGNVAWDAAQQVMGEHKSVYDYALSAVTGLIPSVISSPLAYREGMQNFQKNILNNVAEKNIALHTEAVSNLGKSASPDAIRTEVTRIEAEQIKAQRTAMSSAPPEADRLNAPNLDEAPEATSASKPFNEGSTGTAASSDLTSVDQAREAYGPRVAPRFEDPTFQQVRIDNMTQNADWVSSVKEMSDVSYVEAKALPAGVHVSAGASNNITLNPAIAVVKELAAEYLPTGRIILGDKLESSAKAAKANGLIMSAGDVHYIGVKADGSNPAQATNTAIHELGHAVVHQAAPDVPKAVWDKVNEDWLAFVNKARSGKAPDEVVNQRMAATSADRSATRIPNTVYGLSRDEYLAEQFIKHVTARAEAGELGSMPARVIKSITSALRNALDYVLGVARKGYVGADDGAEQLFRAILAQAGKQAAKADALVKPELQVADMASASMPVGGFAARAAINAGPQPGRISGADFDTAQKYHLDLMPQVTPREKAEFKATVDIYRKAEAWVALNPRDDAKVKLLGNNSVVNVALPATLLAISDNPVARMVAGTLLEQSTGASGRRATAALSKVMLEEKYIGNTIAEYDRFYKVWRNENGGGIVEDYAKNKVRENFNRAVMLERENRLRGTATEPHPMVAAAADSMDNAFERARLDQVETKTVGWARLPESSKGYTPHQIAAARLQEATPAELRVFTEALAQQFKQIEGWSADFSDELARKYLDHARVNANGGHEIPSNVHNPQAASMVKGALEAMGMAKEEVAAMMGRYAAGGPSHTKKRVHLDLTTEYQDGNGGTMTLMSLFNTDQVSLLRSYARRVSGEVALAQYGVMGAQGMTLLRRSLEFGPKVDVGTLKAFDQVAAELLDKPFGTAAGKWLDRVMTLNATARLGGMGFTQLGESLNGIWHVGVGHTMSSIKAMPRLRAEVHALARGEKVSNGILHSMEAPGGGGEFGLEGYKMVTAFDSPEQAFNSYGHDASGWFDRALRGAAHAQGTLSMHRMIQAMQVRGMAEQITLKAIKFIRDGGESKALADMGFTPEMVTRLKADLPNMVVYDNAGRVKEFDITKASDAQLGAQFNQAVRRGAGQIIQRSFIGEQGKWAHDGYLRLLTQFRSYPLVAMEKQWGRQKGLHGVTGAFGILLGSMAAVTPIYYARVALNAVNREDRDAYLEKALDPITIARASLNYVGVAGMGGDLIDALSGLSGVGQSQGGRTGSNKGLVGSVVPGIGYVDDVYRAAVNPSDPHKWAQTMPFSRTPLLIPLINGLRND